MRLLSPTKGETQKQGMAKPKSSATRLGVERSTLIVVQESAEGIVVWSQGRATEALQRPKGGETDRRSRNVSA
jgi:hypothetical protein